jgi:hypothetical protein
MAKILYGTDPEKGAVYNKDGNLYVLPPYYFRNVLGIPADLTHDERHPIFLRGDGWTAHEDGAAFEFSILPSHDPRELFGRIQEAERQVSEQILQHFPNEVLPELVSLPTIGWEIDRWQGMGEDFEYATRFGCDPDADVWDLQSQDSVEDASQHPHRYLGGHVHVSGSPMIAEDPHGAVKAMAFTAGLAATGYSTHPALEKARVYRYGRPGKYRVQNYGPKNPFGPDYAVGIEYRTPSALWSGNYAIAEKVLGWAEIGITKLLGTSLLKEIDKKISKEAIRSILEADQESSLELLSYIESRI